VRPCVVTMQRLRCWHAMEARTEGGIHGGNGGRGSLARGGVSEENRCAMRRKLTGKGKRSRPDDSWLPAPWKTTGCGLQSRVQWASKGRGGLAQGSLPRGFLAPGIYREPGGILCSQSSPKRRRRGKGKM
jgi:hypothetical protein